MNGKIVLLCLLVSFFALVGAVNFTVNQTISLSNRPSSIFVDGGYIYLAFENNNYIQRYTLADDKLRPDRRYGSDDPASSNFIGLPRDMWIDGDYLYVISADNAVFKIEKNTSDITFRGESDSYKPEYAAAVAAKDDKIYLVDKDKDRVNILLRSYDDEYISNGSISYTFLGTGDAIFSSPRDIAIYGDKIYIADSDNDRVAVFYTNLTYAGCYGKGIGHTYLSAPVHIALDDNYLYVVGWGKRTVDVILRENREKVASINSSTYEFREITGIYAYNDKLYVIDEDNKSLIILNIDKTTLMGYDEVQPLYVKMKTDVSYVCELYSVATALNASAIQDRCPYYHEQLESVGQLMGSGKYDDAYAVMTRDMRPKVDGDIAYLKAYVGKGLYKWHSELEDRLKQLAPTIPPALQTMYSSINYMLNHTRDKIDGGNYSGAFIELKELGVRIEMLEMAVNSEAATHGRLNESYSEELANMRERYAGIKEKLALYNITFDDTRFYSLLKNASNALNALDMEAAYVAIHEAGQMLLTAESALAYKEKEAYSANETIVAAQQKLSKLKGSSLPFLSPNTAPIESLISNATAVLYSNPLAAKEYAKQALEAAEKEEKNFEDAKFMLLFSVVVVAFLLIFFGLIGTGLRFLFKRK